MNTLVSSNGENWEHKYCWVQPPPRVTFPPLAGHWSWGLDPPLTFPPIAYGPLRGETRWGMGAQRMASYHLPTIPCMTTTPLSLKPSGQ